MKKAAVLLLALSLSAALVGCGTKKETVNTTEATTTEAATTEEATTEEATTEEATTETVTETETELVTTEAVTEAVTEAATEAVTTEAATEEATTEAAETEENLEDVEAVLDETEELAAATEEETEEATEEVTTEAATEEATEETTTEAAAEEEAAVMSYEEYVAAELDSKVVVETYVQAKQSWYAEQATATVYTQSEDGAYFLYDMACSEEDYEKLTPGTKIKVTGYKAEWSGEVEIVDATFEFVEGDEYVAEALDATELLGTDELINHQNQLAAFKGMTVEASKDAEGNDVAFTYGWEGSGQEGDDLYFNVSLNGETYNFVVESYLCDSTTDVYKAVTELEIGDVIDMEGFLYWNEGVNPHITSVTAAE